MKMRPFSVGETVFGVRDISMSHGGIVTGYQDDEKVLVRFGDDVIPRALPVQSLQRPADRKDEPRRPIGGQILAESTSLGDYMRRMGEAEAIPKKENK